MLCIMCAILWRMLLESDSSLCFIVHITGFPESMSFESHQLWHLVDKMLIESPSLLLLVSRKYVIRRRNFLR